jgi:hypothetical protein
MLPELHKFDLKLCSEQYYKIDLLHWIVAPQQSGGGNITKKPKQPVMLGQ